MSVKIGYFPRSGSVFERFTSCKYICFWSERNLIYYHQTISRVVQIETLSIFRSKCEELHCRGSGYRSLRQPKITFSVSKTARMILRRSQLVAGTGSTFLCDMKSIRALYTSFRAENLDFCSKCEELHCRGSGYRSLRQPKTTFSVSKTARMVLRRSQLVAGTGSTFLCDMKSIRALYTGFRAENLDFCWFLSIFRWICTTLFWGPCPRGKILHMNLESHSKPRTTKKYFCIRNTSEYELLTPSEHRKRSY